MKLYFFNSIRFSHKGTPPYGLIDMLEKNGYRLVKRETLSFDEMTVEYTDYYVFEKLEREVDNVESIIKQMGVEEELQREIEQDRFLDELMFL